MEMQTSAHMAIGVVARRAGVGIDTVRYYEREGLLPAPRRRSSGYRDYDEAAVKRLRFIRRAKELGFSLAEIRELLALSNDHEHGVESVRQRARQRRDAILVRIRELQRLQRGLTKLIDACPGRGDPDNCPILRALGRGEVS